MLKKNTIKAANQNKLLDEAIWYLLVGLIILGIVSWICWISGIHYHNYSTSCRDNRLITYRGAASSISVHGGYGYKTWSSIVEISLDNNTDIKICSTPLYESGWKSSDVDINCTYTWYYTEHCVDGEHYLVSVAPDGLDEDMRYNVYRYISRQAKIALGSGAVFALLWIGCFYLLVYAIVVGCGFESRKQREKRIAEEKRKAERRAIYLEERARLREEKGKHENPRMKRHSK